MANFLLGNSHIHECIFVDRPNKYKYGADEKEGDINRSLVGGPTYVPFLRHIKPIYGLNYTSITKKCHKNALIIVINYSDLFHKWDLIINLISMYEEMPKG